METISSIRLGRLAAWFSVVGLLTFLGRAQADPSIISPPPASGVSPSAAVVFVFSEAMDPDATTSFFLDSTTFSQQPTTDVWSAGNTVLTCTPTPAFPANRMIIWSVDGANPNGDPLGGTPGGFFTTGTGGGSVGSGSGTNAITSFAVGILHDYAQTSTALPALDSTAPYGFLAITSLSSNRTATNILLTLPTGSSSNLVQSFFAHEDYTLFAFDTNLTTFNATFPSGDYTFMVKSVSSNQTVVVNSPAGMVQPGAPHVNNYAAAQTVDPTQPFVLSWDAFPGGTATDYISVEVGDEFSSPDPDTPGSLTGTATSVTIPAGTLQAGSSYEGSIGFYRLVYATNNSGFTTAAYRATTTQFSLNTSSGSGTGGPLVLTNAIYTPANFSFDVLCAPGQTVTVDYRANLAAGSWQTLLTTNSPGSSFRVVAPQSATNPTLFFRARNGP